MKTMRSCVQAIQDCIDQCEGKERIFPLFWVHGQSRDRLAEEIEAIYRCGLRAFCVESRPHPQFCEDAWWSDFGFILDKASSLGMKVWLLDDKHFPTGYANGAIEKKYPALRRKTVRIAFADVAGPVKDGCCLVPKLDEEERVLAVSAFRRTGEDEDLDGGSGMPLQEKDGLVFWDVPAGVWRIFFLISTHRGPAHFKNYIDMCDADSCRLMVQEIYEPHYAHYKKYFGTTFLGFFSDEPCFANNIGSFTDTLGVPTLILPWREDMFDLLAREGKLPRGEVERMFPALWFSVKGNTATVRLAYMNTVTKLYRDHFSRMLGNWCREHGVSYIGHVIEDLGAHMRLGYGCGHYFRAMEGQDMAGMDIVLHQIVPGITGMKHTYSSGSGRRAEPDFYHFTAPKLTTSAAHLDPKKQGRALCEIYGAFGWAEGVPEMKYLTDCLLSMGVNHFVPHAFSDKVEDPDCPPHFFNGGRNPQYGAFADLMRYTARLCHILSSGAPCISAAVYYNAESEWCGSACGSIQDVAAALSRCQTDYDFVPMDVLRHASVEDRQLCVGGERYRVLLLPYCRIIPQALADKLGELAQAGLSILFLEAKPTQTERGVCPDLPGKVLSLRELPGFAAAYGLPAVQCTAADNLRVLCRKDADSELYFFFNAGTHEPVDAQIALTRAGHVFAYDAWLNALRAVSADSRRCRLHLAAGEATLWLVSKQDISALPAGESWHAVDTQDVLVTLRQDGREKYRQRFDTLPDRNFAVDYPTFSGTICYEFRCRADEEARWLRLDRVGETARLCVNDTDCGTAVRAPYVFDVAKAWRRGSNDLTIEVAVNQAYGRRDQYSANAILPPMGLYGSVEVSE